MHCFFVESSDIKSLTFPLADPLAVPLASPLAVPLAPNYTTAVLSLCAGGKSAVAAIEHRRFVTNNQAFFEVNSAGKYFHDFSIDRRWDAITDIVAEPASVVAEILVDTISNVKAIPELLLPMCGLFSEFRIRLTFPDVVPPEFGIKFTGYLLDPDIRRTYTGRSNRTSTHYYTGGKIFNI